MNAAKIAQLNREVGDIAIEIIKYFTDIKDFVRIESLQSELELARRAALPDYADTLISIHTQMKDIQQLIRREW